MKTAIIIHGMPDREEYYGLEFPSASNSHWFPWLQKQLLVRDVLAQTPEMPEPYHPVYEKWQAVFEQFPVNEDTILIGHSRGAGFVLRWISEHDVQVGQVFLIAPSITPNPSEDGFDGFNIDPHFLSKTSKTVVFYSTDDEPEILESVAKIREVIPTIEVREFTDKGHFTLGDMGTREFSELLGEIV